MSIQSHVQDFKGTLARRITERGHLAQAVTFKTVTDGTHGDEYFVRRWLSWCGLSSGIDQLLHVRLATHNEVGKVKTIPIIQKFAISMVGIPE